MRREKKDQILAVLPEKIRGILLNHGLDFEKIQEIRLREEQPLAVKKEGKEELFTHRVTKEELRETMEYVSNYSLYAYENELRQGFLTIEGGHRVGISGKIISEKEQIRNFQYITSINIRICHEITGCANKLFPVILEKGRLCHTMIISPPGGGKTTLLRDLVRQISDGNRWVEGRNVGVVDERSEIGGCYRGVPQNQLGMRTDILDNCPKAEGMMMLVRSMAPEVIAADEIGTAKDVEAIEYAMHCGATMLTTVHGSGMDEIREKPLVSNLVKERCFARYVVMKSGKHVGEIEGIYNERGEKTVYLKMVGCLGIVAATSGYGYSRGMEYQRQITDTGELQRVIRQLAGEMEYTYAPLAQVCASVSRRCSQNYRIWLEHLAKELEMPSRSLAIIWERCCESDLECLLLGREERVRLHELGIQLGSLDKKQEMQIFLQYAEFLEEKRGGLLKEIQEKRRLCNLLGVTAGLFLTILIL